MNEEKKLADVQHGRMVNIAWQAMKPLFDAHRLAALAQLLTEFRSGKPVSECTNLVAKLAVLEDIENDVRAKILRGERAAKGILDG